MSGQSEYMILIREFIGWLLILRRDLKILVFN